jgi:uncharacterized protein (DUF885 family)
MKRILAAFAATIIVGAISIASNDQTSARIAAESKRANEFFDKCWDENLARHPVDESFYGIKTHYDQLEDLSDEKAVADHAVWQKQLATLKRDFNLEQLDPQTQLSYKLFEREADREAEEFKFRFDVYPVSQMRGVHAQIPTFLINIHKIDNVKDAEAYIARLNAIPKLFDQLIVNLQAREDKGVVAPRFVFPLVLDACQKVIQGKPFDSSADNSPLLDDFTKKIGALKDVDSATRDRLLSGATKALKESVKPAYEKLIAFLEDQSKRANDDAGVWKFPDGGEFYASALRRTTTTDLKPDQIHEIGLKEVARIHSEMTKIKDRVGFKGDLQAFFKFMREDRQFYLPDTEEGRGKYLAHAVEIIDEMKKRLDELFTTKPKADIVVKAVEKFREQSAGRVLSATRSRWLTAGDVLRESTGDAEQSNLPTGSACVSRRDSRTPHADRHCPRSDRHSQVSQIFERLYRLHGGLRSLQRAAAERNRNVSGCVFGFRKISARALARRTSCSRYGDTSQKMDAAAGD